MKLICYLSNGYPNLATTKKTAQAYVDAGCDIIEIDLPAADPYLESPFIRERMAHALNQCNDYKQYLETIGHLLKAYPATAMIMLTYEQTIQDIGPERFVSFCLMHGLKDIIYVGTRFPWLRKMLIDQGLNIASYIQFHLPEDDIAAARQTNGFIYLQAKPGTINPQYPTLASCVEYARNQFGGKRPIYCGVGVSNLDDVDKVKKARADGVFVGSAILKLQEDPKAMQKAIQQLKKQTI